MSKAKEMAENQGGSLLNADEETLKLAARSAYDQNPDLMTPKEILLFVLLGYVEEPPTDDGMPEIPDSIFVKCDIDDPF